MKCPHSSAPRGKRIRIFLRDGTSFIDRFVERTGKFVVLENHRLTVDQIRAFSIVRGK